MVVMRIPAQPLRLLPLLVTFALGAACDNATDPGGTCDPATDPDCTLVDVVSDTGTSDVPADAPDTGVDVGSDTADVAVDTTPDTATEDDLDGDGIPNELDGDGDADGDGIPNFRDRDSDGDGIPDAIETAEDDDGDGLPSFLDDDSDGDGFPDADEGGDDIDGDGLPNSRDTDSDGDTLPDDYEGDDDPDEDGLGNLYDTDSDGDGIPDRRESNRDGDEDGIPNYLDLDSDGDGWSDADEYGRTPGSELPPRDSDGDRDADYEDLDSDGDGLADELELGCPDSTDRLLLDSDDDGYTDLLEIAFADGPEDEGQACDPARDITDDVDFYWELRFQGDPVNEDLEFLVDVRRADIAFNMDTTGSMGGEISALQTSLTSVIIPTLAAEIEDSAYAFSQFDDFPCNSHGGGSDRPFILRQRVTTDVAAATAGVLALDRHSGGDGPESGFEAIYQVCTGFGRDDPNCIAGPEVLPFNPDLGFVAGVADGTIGGVGFRAGALPIIVHMTDARSHAKGDEDNYAFGASRNETYASMRAIGAKVIGVASGTPARSDLEQLTLRAGSTVPACAWTDPIEGTRPFGCGDGLCCTGGSGVGRPPIDDVCPLVYDIDSGGGGLDTSIIAGIQALINFAAFDLTTRVADDPDAPIATSQFIESIVPVAAFPPETGCSSEPVIADRNGDGVDDHFLNVVPGTRLIFNITARNDFVTETNQPQVYTAFIEVVQQGGAVLDTQVATILVPPALKPTD